MGYSQVLHYVDNGVQINSNRLQVLPTKPQAIKRYGQALLEAWNFSSFVCTAFFVFRPDPRPRDFFDSADLLQRT